MVDLAEDQKSPHMWEDAEPCLVQILGGKTEVEQPVERLL
jgi:hypothetical protein